MSSHVADFIPTSFSIPAAAVDPAPANTGNGTVSGIAGKEAAPVETITLTCTAAAANAGTFSVRGSVSGPLADATVGVAYVSAIINFTINDGAVDFIVGDNFTIAVAAGFLAEWKGNPNRVGFDYAKSLSITTGAGITGALEVAYREDPAPADWVGLDPAVTIIAAKTTPITVAQVVRAIRIAGIAAAAVAPARLQGRMEMST